MVDIESGRIIDMIYSRETADVARWLKTYPNIRVVSRDGSLMYAKAILEAHPEAMQVSDRFHLIKGLTEAAKKYLTDNIPSRVRIASTVQTAPYWKKAPRHDTNVSEREHLANTEKKSRAVQKVRKLAAQGLKIGTIAKETGHSYVTVQKYLSETFVPANKAFGVSVPSKLTPYMNTIDDMLAKQKKFREIEETIRALGYAGAASTIRMYATRKRCLNQAAHAQATENTEIVERRWLLKLLYHPLQPVAHLTPDQLEKLVCAYPVIEEVCRIVAEFKALVSQKRVHDLEAWMREAKALGSKEIASFVNGMSRDIDAVKNAIILRYNNGLAEGNINKIKLYKRIMFGRCNFDTLRTKTLLLEKRKFN